MQSRHLLAAGALLAGLWVTPAGAMPRFEAAQTLELPHEVAVDLDGAGGARVTWRGDEIARIQLLLMGGFADDPTAWAPRPLDVEAGARLPQASLLEVPLSEGQAGGAPGVDDDLDGRIDEDPFDGIDNDGDGRIDEDFAAIGHQMRVSLADLDGAGLPGVTLRARWSHWPYFHVDDVLFWDASLECAGAALGGAPAARVTTQYELVIADEVIEPHVALGQAQRRRVRFPYLRVEGLDGRRLYLAIVRLDGRTADVLPERDGIVWEAGSRIGWPLALVTAPTKDTLEFSVGQALLTYQVGAHGTPRWAVPPLCARCQQTADLKASLRLARDGDELEITIATGIDDEHLRISAEGAAVEGVPLAPYLTNESATTAHYRLPLESLDAQEIIADAQGHHATLDLVLRNGLSVDLPVDVDVDHDLQPRATGPDPDLQLPQHLAPRLLQSWPNPFQEATTIRFEVPATLGDAFDVDPGDERFQHLDLQAAPPFGANPVVRVRIYNVSGQLIRILDESVRGVGHHSVSWDGTDDQGTPVAAGAYYVNVEMGDYRVTRRVLRLKP